jgi:mRNA interferase MazF
VTRGEVYDTRLDPAEGSEHGGSRPILVISRDAINRASPFVIVVPSTRMQPGRRMYPSHVIVRAPEGGLTADSVLMAEQVRVLDKGPTYASSWFAYRGNLHPARSRSPDSPGLARTMILETMTRCPYRRRLQSCGRVSSFVATPFPKRRKEFLDRFLFRPKVSVKHGHVSNRSSTLLDHELFDGWMAGGSVRNRCRTVVCRSAAMLAIHFGRSTPAN